MKRWLMLFLLLPFVYSFEISEVMFNPIDGNEWIEFFTEKEFNFSGYELTDNLNTDQIVCCNECDYLVPKEVYFLILDKDTTINMSGYYFCVDDNSIGNGLGNNEDRIVITKDNQTYINFSYQKPAQKGNSLSLINHSWIESYPTPWLSNEVEQAVINDTNITNNYCDNCTGFDNSSIIENCNVSLKIETDKILYEKGEQVKIKHVPNDKRFQYNISYGVLDLFGEIIKEKKLTSNTNTKTFTPDFPESEKTFILFADLITSCNNSFIKTSTAMITVKGNKSLKDTKIEISKIPNNVAFGDLFEIEIKIFKGSDRKTAVKIYVEKGNIESEITSLNILSKNEEVEISLPIKMKDRCGVSGTYDIVVEGLDIETRKKIEILELPCKSASSTSKNANSGTSSSGHSKTIKKEYELMQFTKEFSDEVISNVKIVNEDTKEHVYKVWSYIYSGSISLSGEREKNLIEITLKPKEEKQIVLQNTLESETKENNKLKIKILRDDKKTEHEFTEELVFKTAQIIKDNVDNKSERMISNLSLVDIIEHPKTNQITGKVIYEKQSQIQYLSYLLIPIILLLGFIVYKRLI